MNNEPDGVNCALWGTFSGRADTIQLRASGSGVNMRVAVSPFYPTFTRWR
ncbi:MAG: hypothetical protein OJF50_000700 [Nitrospira sp.]|nr:hypothetical protein [Nitrospira sp.]